MRWTTTLPLLGVFADVALCKALPNIHDARAASTSSAESVASAASASSSIYPPYRPTAHPMFQMSSDPELGSYVAEVMALCNNMGAASGEVLRIATQLVPKDFESVYNAFNFMAKKIEALADQVNVTQDPIGAREAYYRASSYYRGAGYFLIGNWSDPRNYDLWDKQLECFNKANALLVPIPGERFKVKAHSPNAPGNGDFETIGIFYKANADDTPTPTVVVGTGYDGSQEEMYHAVVRDVLARGLNVVTYEGPGQPTVLREQKIPFIPDWWNVVTPVVDYLANRSDVDMSKLAQLGISFGAQLAPIAASREPRFAALLSVDGLASIRDAFSVNFPNSTLQLYASGNKTGFNEALSYAAHDKNLPGSSETRWFLAQSLWTFQTHSYYDWWTQEGYYDWTKEMVANITQPTFVTKGQDDLLVGNQANVAYNMLVNDRPNGKNLTTWHEFYTDVGAGEHVALGAESHQNYVMMRWLGDLWGLTFTNRQT